MDTVTATGMNYNFNYQKKRKMNHRKIAVVLIAFLLIAAPVFSQNKSQKRAEKQEKIEAMKIGFISTALNLGESEAQDFWKVYNKYEGDIKKLRIENREVRQKLKGKSIDEMTDDEARDLVDGEMLFRERKLALDMTFNNDLKSILPIKKVLRFHKAQRQFKRKLLKRMQGKRAGKKQKRVSRGREEGTPDMED